MTHKLTDVFLLMPLSYYGPSNCTILHICGRCGAYNVALLLTPIARKMSSILAFPTQVYSPAPSIYTPQYRLTDVPPRYVPPEYTLPMSAASTSVIRSYRFFFPPMPGSPNPTNFRRNSPRLERSVPAVGRSSSSSSNIARRSFLSQTPYVSCNPNITHLHLVFVRPKNGVKLRRTSTYHAVSCVFSFSSYIRVVLFRKYPIQEYHSLGTVATRSFQGESFRLNARFLPSRLTVVPSAGRLLPEFCCFV